MNTISFSGQQNINVSPEIQKRLESEENFCALDKQKLKQDTAEFATKQANEVKKESFIFRTARNLGIKDPKKLFISIGLTLVTTIGLALLGNKMSTKTAEWGVKADEFLKNQKWYNTLTDKIKGAKEAVVKTLRKSKSINNIIDTFQNNMAKPKADLTRGYGRGFVSIFSLTPVDILRKTFKGKSQEEIVKTLTDLVGGEKAKEFAKQIAEGSIKDNRAFCSAFSTAIREQFGCQGDNAKFLDILKQLKGGQVAGKAVEGLTNVTMKDSGISDLVVGNWLVGKGNLGDSLIKFNAVNGTLADTGLGKLLQKSITIPTESVSNFVNDKSKLGAFLCLNTIGAFNNMQDAPKGKKVATISDDFVGTMGSIALATPLAFKTTYGLATLGKTTVNAPLANILRPIGKFFHAGLGDWSKHPIAGKAVGIAGGALRFALIMFVFSSMFQKPMRKVIHKIFGKPYNKAEEEKKKALEEQQNAIIPELGITNKELMEKIQANPKALETLQTNPVLAQQVANDPKLLLDLLDGKEIKPKKIEMSPANKSLLNRTKANLSQNGGEVELKTSADLFSNKKSKKDTEERPKDTATYIPSSEFTVTPETQSDMKDAQINYTLARAEQAVKNAEKLL